MISNTEEPKLTARKLITKWKLITEEPQLMASFHLKRQFFLLMENQVMRHLVIPTLSTGRARDVGHRAARIHNQGKLLWWCPDPKSRRIVPTLRNQSQSESQSQKNNRREITIRYRRMNDQYSGKAHYPFRSRSSWRDIRALGLLDPSRCRRRESGEAREEL